MAGLDLWLPDHVAWHALEQAIIVLFQNILALQNVPTELVENTTQLYGAMHSNAAIWWTAGASSVSAAAVVCLT